MIDTAIRKQFEFDDTVINTKTGQILGGMEA